MSNKKEKLKGMASEMLHLVPSENLATAKIMDKVEILNRYGLLIEQLIPGDSSTTPEMIATLCAITMSENPDIAGCDMQSILNCVIKVAIFDFNPMPMFNECYFIVRNKKVGTDQYGNDIKKPFCYFQIGYEGWLKLMWETGKIERFSIEAVHIDDHFEDIRGSKPKIVHIPCGKTPLTREDTKAVYCVVRLKGVESDISMILYKDRIEHLRKMGVSPYEKNPEKLSGFWEKSYIGMSQAKAIHAMAKFLPLSRSTRNALKSENMLENANIDITPEPKTLPETTEPVIELTLSEQLTFDYMKMDLDKPNVEELAKFYDYFGTIQPFSLNPEFVTKFAVAIENGLIDIKPIPVKFMEAFNIIETAVYSIEQSKQ